MSLTSRIQALTAYANEVTGASDTTLSDAVATLAEGYGQGSSNLASFEYSFTPTENYDSSNKYRMTLDAVNPNNYSIAVYVDGSPEADPDIYIAKHWTRAVISGMSVGSSNSIIRSNGSTGTDGNMVSFTPSTSEIAIGGQYGVFKAGLLYHIHLITEYE